MPDDLPRIPKKRRPRNKPRSDAWLQQELSAYRPLYTFRCAVPITAIGSILCLIIAALLYYSSSRAQELVINYTGCDDGNSDAAVEIRSDGGRTCIFTLELPEIYAGQVLFFYGLRGFHQNIRKYQQSRNDRQLTGHLHDIEDCYPFEKMNFSNTGMALPIVPCGAIANSMFNDSFRLMYKTETKQRVVEVPLTANGLLHPQFRKRKYRNPTKCTDEDEVCGGFENTAKPPWWPRPVAEIGDADTGRALENFDFIQWMETAALPDFRKLYRKLDIQPGNIFFQGLPAGEYQLHVNYSYPVHEFNGEKFFVIQSAGPLGPKADFQMCAYGALGIFLFLFTTFMFVVEFAQPFGNRFRTTCDHLSAPDLSGI